MRLCSRYNNIHRNSNNTDMYVCTGRKCYYVYHAQDRSTFWGAEGAPILFSDLGIRMASCSYIYIYILQQAIVSLPKGMPLN